MTTQQIVILNKSTVCSDDQIKQLVPALQAQINNDFAPRWNIDAQLEFGSPTSGTWQLIVLDNSDQAGALGYHDLTADGLPIAKVFAKTDQQYGDQVSVTMSHELLEMLVDPMINKIVQMSDNKYYAVEVGDAVESDVLGYQINNVRVSDFVLPSYFQPGADGPYDLLKHLNGPCPALAPGGYNSVFDPSTQSWTQIIGQRTRDNVRRALPPLGSRRHRRTIPISERIRSTV